MVETSLGIVSYLFFMVRYITLKTVLKVFPSSILDKLSFLYLRGLLNNAAAINSNGSS